MILVIAPFRFMAGLQFSNRILQNVSLIFFPPDFYQKDMKPGEVIQGDTRNG